MNRPVNIETAENMCQAFMALSPLKKEKAKAYIRGIMDKSEAAAYEQARQEAEAATPTPAA